MKNEEFKTGVCENFGIGFYSKKGDVIYYENENEPKRIKKKYFETELPKPGMLRYFVFCVACLFFYFLGAMIQYMEKIGFIVSIIFSSIFLLIAILTSSAVIFVTHLPTKLLDNINVDAKDVRMLRGADNMLHNAYNVLGDIPENIEQLKKYSYFKKRSKDAIIISVLSMLTIAFIIIIMFLASAAIIYQAIAFSVLGIILILALATNLSLLQRIDTAKPDDETLEFILNCAQNAKELDK